MSDKWQEIYDGIENDDDGSTSWLSLERYNELLAMAIDEKDLDIFRAQKLQCLIGFGGSNNFDATAFDVIEVLKAIRDEVPERWQGAIAEHLGFPENYVNLIYCILSAAELLEYGTSLQSAWISSNGLEILNPAYTDEYRKMIDPKGEMNPYQLWGICCLELNK